MFEDIGADDQIGITEVLDGSLVEPADKDLVVEIRGRFRSAGIRFDTDEPVSLVR